jgi:hypothetical protein
MIRMSRSMIPCVINRDVPVITSSPRLQLFINVIYNTISHLITSHEYCTPLVTIYNTLETHLQVELLNRYVRQRWKIQVNGLNEPTDKNSLIKL